MRNPTMSDEQLAEAKAILTAAGWTEDHEGNWWPCDARGVPLDTPDIQCELLSTLIWQHLNPDRLAQMEHDEPDFFDC